MTELEWLKDKSGLSDEELKAMEAVAGHAKFIGMLQKMIGENEAAIKDKEDAEKSRLELDRVYKEEYIPEMRRVTQDALSANARAAAAEAAIQQAREYGIVPPEVKPSPAAADSPRAPGSPDPNSITRDDFGRFSAAQSRTIIALNDLNAEHFKIFGSPLGDTQGLVDEVARQHTLGNKAFTLQNAWENRHHVAEKRAEISRAERQKEIDAAVAAARKEDAEKFGANPNLRSGQPSRFSSYKPSDAGKEPWKAGHHEKSRNSEWRNKAIAAVNSAA